ncbi:MAG: succinate dehydrogenase cytochrome b subunit [Opitutales bacterium]|nr:succinate dehydrogenase cytochrome b subunit [Opitutales bacterium]
MPTSNSFFFSSLGKKFIMALTGLILVLFVIGHLVGNLQIFAEPEVINQYAHFLHSLGPLLWLVRAFLLITVILHVWMAVLLVIENRKARPQGYEGEHTHRASYASRTMKYSGIIVLAFILFHLAHFTLRVTHPEYEQLRYVLQEGAYQGTEVLDVHAMMVMGFQKPLVSLFYIFAVGLLAFHLRHGFGSMFQTLGLRNKYWAGVIEKTTITFAVAYFLLNAAIPLSVMSGVVDNENVNSIGESAEVLTLPEDASSESTE